MRAGLLTLALPVSFCFAGLGFTPPQQNPVPNFHIKFDPLGCSNLALETFAFTVFLADGSRAVGTSDLCRESEERPARLKIGGRTILPEETDSVVSGRSATSSPMARTLSAGWSPIAPKPRLTCVAGNTGGA